MTTSQAAIYYGTPLEILRATAHKREVRAMLGALRRYVESKSVKTNYDLQVIELAISA